MRVFNLSDVCFFDCETTGVPAKGLKWDEHFNQFPHVVQLTIKTEPGRVPRRLNNKKNGYKERKRFERTE